MSANEQNTPSSKPMESQKQTVTVEILRDIWVGKPGEPERLRKGTIMDVPLDDTILDALENGRLRRVKAEKA